MGQSPVFTTIMDTYYRPAYLRHAVEALRRQTYEKQEIILVNNGATPETVDYLYEVAGKDKRIKLVHFEENQYSPDDPLKMLFTCGNAALRIATGDYIWYQADDDWISDNYAERMVALFDGHPECTTAAGCVGCADAAGRIVDATPPQTRPRYMPGHELALSILRGHYTLRAPGTIFTIRRDAFIKAGGFHRSIELSHLYGIVPFGVTGYDDAARFFWRRHDAQLNMHLSSNGFVSFRETISLIEDWAIEERWRKFGAEIAREVTKTLVAQNLEQAAVWFAMNWTSCRFSAALRISCSAGDHARFWRRIPAQMWRLRHAWAASCKMRFNGRPGTFEAKEAPG